jgi:hypothetical protein
MDPITPMVHSMLSWFEKSIQRAQNGKEPHYRLPVANTPLQGWQANGLLKTGNPVGAVQLQAQFNQQMQTHTIQFNGADNNLTGPVNALRTEAEIIWNVEGQPIRRVVSVLDGMAISGVAQGVWVNVRDVTPPNGVGEITYQVGLTVAPGVRGNTGQPPTLRLQSDAASGDSTNLAPGATGNWLIPAGVGALSAYITAFPTPGSAPLADNDISILFRSANGTNQMHLGKDGCFRYIPFTNQVQIIRIKNERAVGDVFFTCLAGIEG